MTLTESEDSYPNDDTGDLDTTNLGNRHGTGGQVDAIIIGAGLTGLYQLYKGVAVGERTTRIGLQR